MNELLLELVKIQSYSGNEKAIADFIISKLDRFKVKKQRIAKNRYNIIAKKGGAHIWLVAHMDTVSGWIEPKIIGGKLYGRGAVDNKGNIAAALEVGKRLPAINLCFTVGEEQDFAGAKEAYKLVGNDIAIVMEPSSFEIYSAQRGMVTCEIECKGKQGHSAYIKPGDSALEKLVNILASLAKNGWTAFNIGKIEGGIASNVVAPLAKAVISCRPDSVEEFKKVFAALKKYKITKQIPPYANRLVKGKTKKTFTEMAFFKRALVFGVGESEQAHSDREYIKLKDLERAPKELIKLIHRLGGR